MVQLHFSLLLLLRLMILSNLFSWYKIFTTKKIPKRKPILPFIYLLFGQILPALQNNSFRQLGWGLFAVVALCSPDHAQGHPAWWLAGPQDLPLSTGWKSWCGLIMVRTRQYQDSYITPSNEWQPSRYQKGKPKCRSWMVRDTICLCLKQEHGAADSAMSI